MKSLFFEMLQVMLIYLKLTNQIDWTWFWVLSPLWIGGLVAVTWIIIIAIAETVKK